MRFRHFAVFAVLALITAEAVAVVVQVPVTPASVKESKKFSVKVERRDDGLLAFTVTQAFSHPRYVVATLIVRKGDTLLAESHIPAYVREETATYHFALAPETVAGSEFELSERSFSDDFGRPVPVVGGTDYRLRPADFVPPESQPPAGR